MFTNLYAAHAESESEVKAEAMRLVDAGLASMVDAEAKARANVAARRAPTITKAFQDQGGPISGGSV